MVIVAEPHRSIGRGGPGSRRGGYRRRRRSFRRRLARRLVIRVLICLALSAGTLVLAPLLGAFVYAFCGLYLSGYVVKRAMWIPIAAREIAEARRAMQFGWPVQAARLLWHLRGRGTIESGATSHSMAGKPQSGA